MLSIERSLFGFIEYLPLFPGGVVTFVISLIIVLTKKWHGSLTFDIPSGIQKNHTTPTPRVGGFSLFTGLWAVYWLSETYHYQLLLDLLIAAMPVVSIGLLEDISKRVTPRDRLLATMLGAMLACYLTGYSLTSLEIWGVDFLLSWGVISGLFTTFAIAGLANAINIIDGFNGLAAGTAIIALTAIAYIANIHGDFELVYICSAIAAATTGFLIINFPLGKLFLGDGGAYCLGFLVGWMAVLLPERNTGISPWTPLVICAYPIIEVLFSIIRRMLKSTCPANADNLHLHSLIKSRFIGEKTTRWPNFLQNSLVSVICWTFSIFNSGIAILWAENTAMLMTAFIINIAMYCACYYAVIACPEYINNEELH